MAIGGRVNALRWDEWNIAHIAKHLMEPEDGAKVVWGSPLIEETYKSRLLVIGPNAAGRLLTVIVGEVPGEPDNFYVFSARPASRRERMRYAMQVGTPNAMNNYHTRFRYPTEAHGPIPAFASIEEEAEFWDTHDAIDFSELGPDNAPANSHIYEFDVELTPAEIKLLIRQARSRGMSLAALVQTWVRERIQQESLVHST